MKGVTNPANNPKNFKQIRSHQPSISWSEVSELMKKLDTNTCNGADELVFAVWDVANDIPKSKCFLQLQWNWIKKVDAIECFV